MRFFALVFLLFLLTSCNNNSSFELQLSEKTLKIAKSKIGSKYRYAAAGENSFDCSGFVYWVYSKKLGIKIPRTSIDQSKIGKRLSKKALKKGDLVFFDTSGKGHVNHSGIYIGGGRFIHASSGKAHSVTISDINKGFYKDKFLWGISQKEIAKH